MLVPHIRASDPGWCQESTNRCQRTRERVVVVKMERGRSNRRNDDLPTVGAEETDDVVLKGRLRLSCTSHAWGEVECERYS